MLNSIVKVESKFGDKKPDGIALQKPRRFAKRVKCYRLGESKPLTP